MATLSIGYKLIKDIIGTKYADIIYEIASRNSRSEIMIPSRFDSRTKLYKIIPHDLLKKLIFELGGQRLYLRKEHRKIDDANLRRKAANDLQFLGYDSSQVSQLLSISNSTLKNRYLKTEN